MAVIGVFSTLPNRKVLVMSKVLYVTVQPKIAALSMRTLAEQGFKLWTRHMSSRICPVDRYATVKLNAQFW